MKKLILVLFVFAPVLASATVCTDQLMGAGIAPLVAETICKSLQPDKLEIPNGALSTLPSTCAVGELYVVTDDDDCASSASGDGAICICKSSNTWALQDNF